MQLGCIGDDFTGSSDLANTLAKGGMAVTQYTGVPDGPAAKDVDAGVVALKSRTIPAEQAVTQSLAALEWLLEQGCSQILFKYCSTFDSTANGNIGPVAEALADRLGEGQVIFCPAFPATGRQIFQGHLFVGDQLLSESGMRNHPLTPMTDPDLRRVLAAQTRHAVGHVAANTVRRGTDAIRKAMADEAVAGRPFMIVDAIEDDDLVQIGKAVSERKLLTGGSGIALGLPGNFGHQPSDKQGTWSPTPGPGAVLSGSCSIATRGQVALFKATHPSFEISTDAVMAGDVTPETLSAWIMEHINEEPLAYSSADPDVIQAAQTAHGREASAEAIEHLFAATARRLADAGVTRLVTAGGETSGAVVEGLSVTALDIGPEIAPGVPAVKDCQRTLGLALKSGNFGQEDFFERALAALAGR